MPNTDENSSFTAQSFFSGLVQARAYLQREVYDAGLIADRLGHLARDLLSPRSPRGLVLWLGEHLAQALGSSGYALWPPSDSQRPWVGTCREGPWLGSEVEPAVCKGNGCYLSVPGLAGTVLQGYFEGVNSLDQRAVDVLSAICGAAGMAFEQAQSRIEASVDPRHGLLPKDALVRMLTNDTTHGVFAVAAHFMLFASGTNPSTKVAALRDVLPPGTQLGRWQDGEGVVLAACLQFCGGQPSPAALLEALEAMGSESLTAALIAVHEPNVESWFESGRAALSKARPGRLVVTD